MPFAGIAELDGIRSELHQQQERIMLSRSDLREKRGLQNATEDLSENAFAELSTGHRGSRQIPPAQTSIEIHFRHTSP